MFGFNTAAAPTTFDPSQIAALFSGGAPAPVQGSPAPMAQPQPDPQQAQAPQPQGYSAPPDVPVSPVEAIMSWLAHGGTPGEAAASARAVKIQNIQNAMSLARAQDIYRAEQGLGNRDRLDAYLNPAEFGKADAQNLVPQLVGPDQTAIFRSGPNNPGGSQFQGAGTYTAANGVLTNSQRGIVGNYATPQIVAGQVKPFSAGFQQPGVAPPVMPQGLSRWSVYGQQPQGAPAMPRQGPGAMPPPAGNAQPTPAAAPMDGRGFFRSFVLPHEGGLNPADMNGAPTKYGINQKANPGVNVASLTPQQAENVFMQKYWGPSGAASMPAPLAAVHADTYFINPKMARTFLQQSGGDPNTYLGLREQWMQGMLQNNPKAAPYARAWGQRNAALAQMIGGGALPQAQSQPSPQAPGGGLSMPTQIGQGSGPGMGVIPASDPINQRFPAGTVLKRTPGGDIEAMPGTSYGPEQLIGIRGQLQNEEPIKNWRIANTAYGAMVNAAAQPNGGMRAYALRDTFARLINPGAVARVGTIEALKQAQGVPAAIQAYFMNLKGDGDVPPQIAQQILDVGRGFLSSHYASAKATNDNYSQFAQRHHIDPADIAVPLGDEPARMVVGSLPPKAQLVPGQIYSTRHGPATWTGSGFKRFGGQ